MNSVFEISPAHLPWPIICRLGLSNVKRFVSLKNGHNHSKKPKSVNEIV